MRSEPALIPIERRRRMWRLTYLLSGDHARGVRVLRSILADARDPASLDPVHLDRLVLQHARQVLGDDPREPTGGEPRSDAARLLRSAQRLRRQSLEAWVLTRVEGADEVHVARAMDCSKTAATRFLATADAFLDQHEDAVRSAARELRNLSLTLNPDDAFDEAVSQLGALRRRRFAARFFPIAVAALYLIVAVLSIV